VGIELSRADTPFICLLGIDGAGKTETAAHLKQIDPRLAPITWEQFHDVSAVLPLPKGLHMATILDSLQPPSRAGLLAYMLALEYDLGIRPKLEQGQPVLVDSYWFKIAAREKLLKRSAPWLLQALETLPPPDIVIFLDTPPEVAVQRKKVFTSVEYFSGIQDFVEFQTQVRAEILRLIKPLRHVILDGLLPVETLAQKVLEVSGCVR
jgi:thymidylate kinase